MLRSPRAVRPLRRAPTSVVVVGLVAAALLAAACTGTEAAEPPASVAGTGTGPRSTDGVEAGTILAAPGSTVAPDTAPPKVHPETPAHARLVAAGIPDIAARAYLNASVRASEALPGCTISPEELAGIGGAESRHGQVGEIDQNGDSKEIIRGFAPTGDDTDGGELDGDKEKDWAVGPMQFTPETWKDAGRDGNDDGRSDPSNFFDAALAAAADLCSHGGPFPSAASVNTQWNQWDQNVRTAKARFDAQHDRWQKETDRRQKIQDFIDQHPDDTTDPQALARLAPLGPEPQYQDPALLSGPAQYKGAVEGYYGPAGDTRDQYVDDVISIFRGLTNATGGVVVTPEDRW